MAVDRLKGQFLQQATSHLIPKISGSFLSVDGMVDFDTAYLQADYPNLFAEIGITYNKSGDNDATEFRTPSLSDWGLPELKTVSFTGSVTIDLYDTTVYDCCTVEAVLSNGSKKESIDVKVINDGSDVEIDIANFAVKDNYFNVSITESIAGNILQMTIADAGSDGEITMRYIVTPKPLVLTNKYMIRI